MQIWLDTINFEVIAEAQKLGLISGITTNPSILSGTKNVRETLTKLLDLQPGSIAVQVTAEDSEGMVEDAKRIFAFSNRMIVKIPMNNQGLMAMKQVRDKNIPFLATGIFYPNQAFLAAQQEALFIAPYFAHMGEHGNAQETLKTILNILKANKYTTKLLVASLRSLDDLIYCSLLGADAVTLKEDLFYKLVADTYALEKFSQKFQADWRKAHGNASLKDLL